MYIEHVIAVSKTFCQADSMLMYVMPCYYFFYWFDLQLMIMFAPRPATHVLPGSSMAYRTCEACLICLVQICLTSLIAYLIPLHRGFSSQDSKPSATSVTESRDYCRAYIVC